MVSMFAIMPELGFRSILLNCFIAYISELNLGTNIADFHISWKVVDNHGKLVNSGIPYNLKSAVSPATFSANISYNESYEACDLVLYRQEMEGSNRQSKELRSQSKDFAKLVKGKYSLHLTINQ